MSGAASVRHNVARLLRFSGRDSRAQFWPWAIAVFLLGMVLDIIAMIPMMTEMMRRMFAYIKAHPEGLPQPQPGGPPLPPELMPDFSGFTQIAGAVGVLTVLLWWAAVVRRLHDRDRSGWWGAVILPFQIAAILLAPPASKAMLSGAVQSRPVALIASLNGAGYWIAFIFLLVILAGNGTPGPNRYGDPPSA